VTASTAFAEHVRSVYSVTAQDAQNDSQPGLVVRSWRRCLNEYGLDPARAPNPRTVELADLKHRVQRCADLVACAKLEMANLYQQLADSQTAVVLTDTDGVILSVVGESGFTRDAARLGLREGAVWSEREQGTNGMGTCLVEKSPIVIHRDQHFLARNIHLTCTATPIFDSMGELAAVLDVSSQSRMLQQHSLVLVGMSAQMIENRTLLARHKNEFVIRFHSRPEFVYTLHEGELALSGDGKVVAANRSALFQLGIADFRDIVGREVGQLFNTNLPDLVSRSTLSSFHPVPVYGARQGSRFFAVAQQPERQVQQFRVVVERHASQRSAETAPDHRMAALEFGDARMADNIRCAVKVLNHDIPILLCGETGSGKDRFAKAMHAASSRAAAPFVAVNCASLPDSLIESELFGYRSGAFTGASREGRRGKIVQASGGTLFLDEIGDMPLPLQARLLRVLEEREVVPLGGEAAIQVDIQLISATHRNLQEMVKTGAFREDLYFRLQGIVLCLPPLRERSDRRKLIQHALAEEGGDEQGISLDPQALDALDRFHWPGNMRQLRNVLRTALALCESKVITLAELPAELRHGEDACPAAPVPSMLPQCLLNSLESAERDALLHELERHRWNISSLSHELKTSRNTIYRKMKRLNIRSGSTERVRA
jgi:transcriptional regulator of acetoin/glycerol metabolism